MLNDFKELFDKDILNNFVKTLLNFYKKDPKKFKIDMQYFFYFITDYVDTKEKIELFKTNNLNFADYVINKIYFHSRRSSNNDTKFLNWIIKNNFQDIHKYLREDLFKKETISKTTKTIIADKFLEQYLDNIYKNFNASQFIEPYSVWLYYCSEKNLKKYSLFIINKGCATRNERVLKSMNTKTANEYFDNVFPKTLFQDFYPLSKLNEKNRRKYWIKILYNVYKNSRVISLNRYNIRTVPEDLKDIFLHMDILQFKKHEFLPRYIFTKKEIQYLVEKKFIKLKEVDRRKKIIKIKELTKKEIRILNTAKKIRAPKK